MRTQRRDIVMDGTCLQEEWVQFSEEQTHRSCHWKRVDEGGEKLSEKNRDQCVPEKDTG